MTIRPVAPADLASLAELAATIIRKLFGPPHKPENRADEYRALARPGVWLQAAAEFRAPEIVMYGEMIDSDR